MKTRDFRILLVDTTQEYYQTFQSFLDSKYHLQCALNFDEAKERLSQETFHLVMYAPAEFGSGEFAGWLKQNVPSLWKIAFTSDIEKGRSYRLEQGFADFLLLPPRENEVTAVVEDVFERCSLSSRVLLEKMQSQKLSARRDLIGKSRQIQEVRDVVQKIADVYSSVLITGERGVERETVARLIHEVGLNKNESFVNLQNIKSSHESLAESLFKEGFYSQDGSEAGGTLELANSGDVYIEEVSLFSEEEQGKLLSLLQTDSIESKKNPGKRIRTNVRVIASTSENMDRLLEKKKFRKDLYYRLNVVHIHIPPLRERKEDIEDLVKHYVDSFSLIYNKKIKGVTEKALKLLQTYSWPGNTVELANIVERMVLLAEKDVITEKNVPIEIVMPENLHLKTITERPDFSYKEERGRYEREMIIQVLRKVNFNQTKAAKALNIHRNTLLIKLQRFNIDVHALKKESRELEVAAKRSS